MRDGGAAGWRQGCSVTLVTITRALRADWGPLTAGKSCRACGCAWCMERTFVWAKPWEKSKLRDLHSFQHLSQDTENGLALGKSSFWHTRIQFHRRTKLLKACVCAKIWMREGPCSVSGPYHSVQPGLVITVDSGRKRQQMTQEWGCYWREGCRRCVLSASIEIVLERIQIWFQMSRESHTSQEGKDFKAKYWLAQLDKLLWQNIDLCDRLGRWVIAVSEAGWWSVLKSEYLWESQWKGLTKVGVPPEVSLRLRYLINVVLVTLSWMRAKVHSHVKCSQEEGSSLWLLAPPWAEVTHSVSLCLCPRHSWYVNVSMCMSGPRPEPGTLTTSPSPFPTLHLPPPPTPCVEISTDN